MFFTDFKKSKQFLRNNWLESETTICSLWKAQTKIANSWKSLKTYMFLQFLRKVSQTFKKSYLQYLENYVRTKLKKKVLDKKTFF